MVVPAEDRIPQTPGADRGQPICLLISGGAGAGKSTIAQLSTYFLRERIGETAALSTDEFYRMFDPHWTSTNRDWWRMAWELCLSSARWLFQNGVKIDDQNSPRPILRHAVGGAMVPNFSIF
jgi:adenylylsulfate kinase-like enzyme